MLTDRAGVNACRVLTFLTVILAGVTGMLVSADAANAESQLTVLHSFASLGVINPRTPLIQATDGNFYGTTEGGGAGQGTVFKMTPSGTITVLHAFTGGSTDGASPFAGLIEATDGNFYGTTISGGTYEAGTIFKMTPSGTLTVLHAFSGGTTDGANPEAPLIQGTDGNFYGTTEKGGASFGTVFKMTPSGTVTALHVFIGGTTDGANPVSPLIQGTDGNFYGTTENGGAGFGTVFKVTASGSITLLHAFISGQTDGAYPYAALIQATDGNFYGTTETGGLFLEGTVFKMTPSGTVSILHAFYPSTEGGYPEAALIEGTDGNFYGTTSGGGASGDGTVFQVTPIGTFTVLHTFVGGQTDGASSYAALIQATDGNFYGTTEAGGSGAGTAFEVTSGGAFTLLHAFTGSADGGTPQRASLIQGTDGNFYGTTPAGGATNEGTVFKMTPSGTVTILHAFIGGTTDGEFPEAGLIQATDGNFYGTTEAAYGAAGTIFKMTPSGTVTVLHKFDYATDGASPYAAVIQATDGNFYGTTSGGGASGDGTVFRMSPDGTVTVLHTFVGGQTDGAFPQAALIQATDGNFYGTTVQGGTSGFGTVFKVTASGTFTVLHAFAGGTTDGGYPDAGLIEGTNGNFYGTTVQGGLEGTVFQMTPSGAVTILHAFTGGTTDGANPVASLIQAMDGNFYGTAFDGGATNEGTVFKMTPRGSVTVLHTLIGGTTDGANSQASLIQGTDGNFYGTAGNGGTYGTGVVFELSLPAAPAITTEPANRTVKAGQSPQFTVAASGTPTYQWQVSTDGGLTWSNLPNTSPYSGVTTTTLTIAGASLGLSGSQYRALATNTGGAAASSAALLTVSPSLPPGDFDGDHKSDITVFRPSSGTWYVRNSTTGVGTSLVWGGAGDVPVPGDYDGDGLADMAVFRLSTGTWYIRYTATGASIALVWGGAGDIPVPGDYDGDGLTDMAVFRPSTGTWYVRYTATGAGVALVWGGAGDQPVAGDYDGDGKTDMAVFRPSTGVWYIRYTATGAGVALVWGASGDMGVPGDYDGDGLTDMAIFRPSTGTWYIRYTATGASIALVWGASIDLPVPGDYDGDGLTDIAVFRPSTGIWYVRYSATGTGPAFLWGGTGDIPLP